MPYQSFTPATTSSTTSYTKTPTDLPTPSPLIADHHISIIVGVVIGVVFIVVIVCITIFLCKKCARRPRQTGGSNNAPSSEDNPGPDAHYEEAMQQRMDEWAAIRRRRPAKPFDKPGNNSETAFVSPPGNIF